MIPESSQEEALKILEACGTSWCNPDTCGVCKLHFHECEEDISCVGDEVDQHDIPTGREFSCAGARARLLLKKIKEHNSEWFD